MNGWDYRPERSKGALAGEGDVNSNGLAAQYLAII